MYMYYLFLLDIFSVSSFFARVGVSCNKLWFKYAYMRPLRVQSVGEGGVDLIPILG